MKEPIHTRLDDDIVCIDALYTGPGLACCHLVRGGDVMQTARLTTR